MSGGKPTNTPDGLVCYEQEGVGLVVSASEHNHRITENMRGAKMLADNATVWRERAEAAENLSAIRLKALTEAQRRADIAEALVAELRTALNLCAFPNLVGGESSQLLDTTQSRQAIARAALAKIPADMGAESTRPTEVSTNAPKIDTAPGDDAIMTGGAE